MFLVVAGGGGGGGNTAGGGGAGGYRTNVTGSPGDHTTVCNILSISISIYSNCWCWRCWCDPMKLLDHYGTDTVFGFHNHH